MMLFEDIFVERSNDESNRYNCIKMMKVIDTIALILVIIGAINWGLIGLFNFDLVAILFGTMTAISRIVYVIIGIAGLWSIRFLAKSDEN